MDRLQRNLIQEGIQPLQLDRHGSAFPYLWHFYLLDYLLLQANRRGQYWSCNILMMMKHRCIYLESRRVLKNCKLTVCLVIELELF